MQQAQANLCLLKTPFYTHRPHCKPHTLLILMSGRARHCLCTCSKLRKACPVMTPFYSDHTANHLRSWFWWVAGPGLACACAGSLGKLLSPQDPFLLRPQCESLTLIMLMSGRAKASLCLRSMRCATSHAFLMSALTINGWCTINRVGQNRT